MMPALLIRMLTTPTCSLIFLHVSITCWRLVTSHVKPNALPPLADLMAATVSEFVFSLTSTHTTVVPRAAYCSARFLPMP
uniref:Putative secreted protein n=1 Tax=Anopheles darlingi TaxID=43151 RepID=A0A2M4D726_ANODA